MTVTLAYERRAPAEAEAIADGDALLLAPGELERATGWELKPQGLCRGDACVPARAGLVRDGAVDLAAFARLLGQPVVRDEAGSAWVVGEPARRSPSAEAPGFELPDLQGRLRALSSFRGDKVVLLSWASWCGCRRDLPAWDALHRELAGEGFTLVSVASDSGGAAAAEEWLRGTAHPALIDEWHVVSELYGLVNVPNAVWIDEQGRIARPAETAGAVDTRIDRATLTRGEEDAAAWERSLAAYMDAIRDWVRTGRHALPGDEVARRVDPASAEAAAHHRLATLLMRRGDAEAARRHLDAAVSLEPGRWMLRRDAWALDNERVGGRTPLSAQGRHADDYWAALDELGDRRFYPPPELD